MPKSHRKVVRDKSMKHLTRSVFSFWILGDKSRKDRKDVIGKRRKQLTKEGANSFLEVQYKSMKERKS